VAGGIPIIKTLREGCRQPAFPCLRHSQRHDELHSDDDARERPRLRDVLAEAQRLGYAEADPSFDIDGVDASHKLAILASVAFGRR